MKNYWYKILSIVLLLYAILAGFTIQIPDTNIGDTLRNVFFHVGMWFAMLAVMTASFTSSIKFLSSGKMEHDLKANEAVNVGVYFGILGIITGMLWATFTWGEPWANDPHLNGAAVSLLVYFAYLVLRSAVPDDEKRARISAVYNIFAFVILLVFVGVLPRLSVDTLHPGSGDGNPAFGDMDATMRYVFYPALIGWIMLSLWVLNLKVRYKRIENFIEEKELD
ncbi:MAG: ABC transporter permease [Bacteroidetes bacterium]|nr:MAG: ABC transporter permease [Bacteroidota bacterium]